MLSILLLTAAVTLQPDFLVQTSWLADHTADSNVVVLDVTTLQGFAQGHIPNARRIDPKLLIVNRGRIPDELPPIDRLEALFTTAGIANARRIIIYSRDPLLATRAFFTLDYLGYGDRIAILDGGLQRWTAEKRPITREISSPAAVPFQAVINHATLVNKAELKDLISRNAVVLIDARPLAQVVGTERGKDIKRAGHIPSAKCLPWTANLQPDENRIDVLKPEAGLRSMYASFLPAGDEKIVVYCRTGMEGSMTYFVLRYLGYQPALYDGSFIEWNETEPVARAAKVRS